MVTLLHHISRGGRVSYTRDSVVYHALASARVPRQINRLFLFLTLAALVLSSNWFSWGFIPIWWLIFLSFIPFYFAARQATMLNPATIARSTRGSLADWIEAGSAAPGLIGSDHSAQPPEGIPSAENLEWIVVEDDLTAVWLAANGFPPDHRAVVVSLQPYSSWNSGLPDSLSSPSAVYLLHSGRQDSGNVLHQLAGIYPHAGISQAVVHDLGPDYRSVLRHRRKVAWPDDGFPLHALPYSFIQRALEEKRPIYLPEP
jgi:hypothetical protein